MLRVDALPWGPVVSQGVDDFEGFWLNPDAGLRERRSQLFGEDLLESLS
jgi:hypothetical protein